MAERHLCSSTLYAEDVLRGGHSTVWGSYFDATSRRWGYACCRSLDRNEACPQNEPQAVDKAESSEEEDAAAQAQLIAWQDGQLLDARHTPEQPPVLGRQTPEDFLAHFVLYWFHHWTEHENPPKAQRQTTHEALLQLMQRLKRKALDRSLLQHLTQYADLAQRREYAQADDVYVDITIGKATWHSPLGLGRTTSALGTRM
ncbi:unnamed protein product [Durusdinium trenchii]|uniref:Pre-mRNA-splicing factor SLU7 n=1 Tax=Durusdinium trenchii TaxID=1381693 RepID=A0ABP0MGP0_9DINO